MTDSEKEVKYEETMQKINNSEKIWGKKIQDLIVRFKESHVKHAPEIQADVISNRQFVVDEVSIYGVKIYRERQHIKKLEKARYEFYATSYPIKTSGPEKLRLINADLADRQFMSDRYDEHVNFLREVSKNLDSLNYAVKNKITLMTILGGYE